MKLENKAAMITRAAAGIGQVVAILAGESAKIAVLDHRTEAAEPTVEQIRVEGGGAITIGLYITHADEVKRSVGEFGLSNVLFNNAGGVTEGRPPLIENSGDSFDRADGDAAARGNRSPQHEWPSRWPKWLCPSPSARPS